MNYIDQSFAESMRFLRKGQGYTLEDLQKRTGVPLWRLRAVDAGEIPPYLMEAQRISSALGTTIDAMIRGAVSSRHTGAFRNVYRSLPKNDNRGNEQT